MRKKVAGEGKVKIGIGLPYNVVTVLAALADGRPLTEEGVAEAREMVRLGIDLIEASPGAPFGFAVTAAGRQRLAEICNRCGRGLSPNGHCHPCAEDKILMETDPSAFIGMRNAFGDHRS